MTTIATVTARTYKAVLHSHGICTVSGLHARDITAEYPDTTRAADRRKALRAEIQAALWAKVPRDRDDPHAGTVISWEADL